MSRNRITCVRNSIPANKSLVWKLKTAGEQEDEEEEEEEKEEEEEEEKEEEGGGGREAR